MVVAASRLWEPGDKLKRVLGQRRDTPDNEKWSGRWESNPRLKLGKLGYYHYTTPAPLLDSSRLLEDQATSTDRGQIRRGDGVPGDGWPAVQSLAAGGRSRIDERAVGEHALHALVAVELQDVAAEIHSRRPPPRA